MLERKKSFMKTKKRLSVCWKRRGVSICNTIGFALIIWNSRFHFFVSNNLVSYTGIVVAYFLIFDTLYKLRIRWK